MIQVCFPLGFPVALTRMVEGHFNNLKSAIARRIQHWRQLFSCIQELQSSEIDLRIMIMNRTMTMTAEYVQD